MSKILSILLLIVISFCGLDNAFGQECEWARRAWGTDGGVDYAYSAAIDAYENVYVTGYFFSATINFDTIVLSNISGCTSMFLVKYDSTGTIIWAKSVGGLGHCIATSNTVDIYGNIYVTGHYSNSALVFGTTVLSSIGYHNIFIAKYDATGNLLWAKSAGGIKDDRAYSIATDGTGNVVVSGNFTSSIMYFGTTILTNADSSGLTNDIFLAKYDSSGNLIWAKSASGNNNDYAQSIVVDNSGNTYITGTFSSTSLVFGTTNLTNAGDSDIFIVKYDTAGSVIWAQSAGSIGEDEATSVSCDVFGNVYITGIFSSPTITFGTTTIINYGICNIFLVKYTPIGNILWAKSIGGNNADASNSVSVDDSSNIFITGTFWSPTLTVGSTTLTQVGNGDIFLMKFDSSGFPLWAKSAGGFSSDIANCVITKSVNSIYITGYFGYSTLSFGTTSLIDTNMGGTDIFLAKYKNIPLRTPLLLSQYRNINLYPNPTTNKLTLTTNNHSDISTIVVYDILGRQIIYQNNILANNNDYEIQLPEMKDGVYYLQAVGSDVNVNLPFVVKKL